MPLRCLSVLLNASSCVPMCEALHRWKGWHQADTHQSIIEAMPKERSRRKHLAHVGEVNEAITAASAEWGWVEYLTEMCEVERLQPQSRAIQDPNRGVDLQSANLLKQPNGVGRARIRSYCYAKGRY